MGTPPPPETEAIIQALHLTAAAIARYPGSTFYLPPRQVSFGVRRWPSP